ncbi:MAG: ribosomal protein S18-alanine N-acetyltransferase [Pseudobutyrivibrio sp.]|nr:ribosomal protein S18-alanine N-acetyltransferase [Pseudobutyrivibrio sp.]
MSLEFRHADIKDIDRILEIERASMSAPWSRASFIEAIESDHAFVILAMYDGEMAGYAVFYLTVPEAELPDIVISEEYRGLGIGRALLNHSIEELQSSGVEKLFLEVRKSNTPARQLYETFGFEQIGIRKYFYSDPVEDAICMSFEMK